MTLIFNSLSLPQVPYDAVIRWHYSNWDKEEEEQEEEEEEEEEQEEEEEEEQEEEQEEEEDGGQTCQEFTQAKDDERACWMFGHWASPGAGHYDGGELVLHAVEKDRLQSSQSVEEPDKSLLDLTKSKKRSQLVGEEEEEEEEEDTC